MSFAAHIHRGEFPVIQKRSRGGGVGKRRWREKWEERRDGMSEQGREGRVTAGKWEPSLKEAERGAAPLERRCV